MRVAFKEWAVVVDALSRGDQIIILRKGGISEGPGGFVLEHNRFLLFPTLFHQQRDLVIGSAQARYDIMAPSLSPSAVHLDCFAEVLDWRLITSLDSARRLQTQHIWRDEVIEERFTRQPRRSLYALAVRVSRLARPVEIPMRVEYGGCKSWIQLEQPISAEGAQPVLTNGELAEKLANFESALGPCAQTIQRELQEAATIESR